MAFITKGILGPVTGTVGTVTGSSWKGRNYIRSKTGARKRAATEKQLQQQAKFRLVSKFIRSLNGFLAIGFKNQSPSLTPANAALSFNLKNSIMGSYPDYTINYNLALVSRGDLPNGGAPAAGTKSGNKIHFSWADNSGTGMAKATDQSMLLVHCPALEQSVYSLESGLRNAQSADVDVAIFAGQQVEVFISFVNEAQTEVANSLYLGSMQVIA